MRAVAKANPEVNNGIHAYSSEGDAWPSIDAKLDHLKSIIQQEMAEIGGPFPLFLRFDREVKGDHQPSHFVRVRVHGR